MKKYLILIVFISAFAKAQAQQQDSLSVQQIDTVYLKSTRLAIPQEQLPQSISVYKGTILDQARPQGSLQEFVQGVPGLFAQNTTNYAQDLRISIRGFGNRAAFGIRGVKLIVDGIPETTPDGQGQVDNLNLGIVEKIEVLRGSNSVQYGNASGGAIHITTLENVDSTFTNYRAGIGSFGYQNYQATGALVSEDNALIFHGSYTRGNGYRAHSKFQQINTNFKGRFQLEDNLRLQTIVNFSDSPIAEDPGGLTQEQLSMNPEMAREQNITFDAAETIRQFKVGLSLDYQRSQATLITGYAFYANRLFDGRLPFENSGALDLRRNYLGQGTSLRYSKWGNQLQVGYDIGYQSDNRERYNNLEGERGDLVFNQRERFTNLGIYLLDSFVWDNLTVTGGMRYDINELKAEDNFLDNGDASGDSTLNAVSFNGGLSYLYADDHSVFVSVGTSFETPTLSELSANPSGIEGFNPDLEPQRAITYELGLRGKGDVWSYEFVGFKIDTEDDLVPFQLEAFPDRNFFQNAGSTERVGVELSGGYAFLPAGQAGAKAFSTTISYAYSQFTFDEFVTSGTDLSDKMLPGIPEHRASLAINYSPESSWNAGVNVVYVSEQFADNTNETRVDNYVLVSGRVQYIQDLGVVQFVPFLAVENALDAQYVDNVRINAFGGRFFEPGPSFQVYGGLQVRL